MQTFEESLQYDDLTRRVHSALRGTEPRLQDADRDDLAQDILIYLVGKAREGLPEQDLVRLSYRAAKSMVMNLKRSSHWCRREAAMDFGALPAAARNPVDDLVAAELWEQLWGLDTYLRKKDWPVLRHCLLNNIDLFGDECYAPVRVAFPDKTDSAIRAVRGRVKGCLKLNPPVREDICRCRAAKGAIHVDMSPANVARMLRTVTAPHRPCIRWFAGVRLGNSALRACRAGHVAHGLDQYRAARHHFRQALADNPSPEQEGWCRHYLGRIAVDASLFGEEADRDGAVREWLKSAEVLLRGGLSDDIGVYFVRYWNALLGDEGLRPWATAALSGLDGVFSRFRFAGGLSWLSGLSGGTPGAESARRLDGAFKLQTSVAPKSPPEGISPCLLWSCDPPPSTV